MVESMAGFRFLPGSEFLSFDEGKTVKQFLIQCDKGVNPKSSFSLIQHLLYSCTNNFKNDTHFPLTLHSVCVSMIDQDLDDSR